MIHIILVGAGKAGYLHLNSYLKMVDRQKLTDVKFLFVDPLMAPGKDLEKLCHERNLKLDIWPNLESLVEANCSETKENYIVDLCIPSAILFSEFCHALALGFKKVIIEKPIIISTKISQDMRLLIEQAEFFMVKNYLYSFSQYKIRELIQEFELCPEMLLTNFSKNRVKESFSGRAFTSQHVPTVFEIEIPHQLYIADSIFGQQGTTIYSKSEDMIQNGQHLKDHGTGVVIDYFGKKQVAIHYSNLQHIEIIRTLDIFCSDDYTIHVVYSPICKELSDIKSSVLLMKNNKVIKKFLCLERDDNMFNMLSTAIDALIYDSKNKLSDINDLIYSSERLLNIIDKSKNEESRIKDNILGTDLSLTHKLIINSYISNGDSINNFIQRSNISKFNKILAPMFTT